MTHSRNERRWSAVPAIGGLFAALLILSSCAREASSPVSPEAAVVASSIQSAAANKAAGFLLTVSLEGTGNGMVKSSPSGIACGGTVNKGGNGGNGGNCNGVFDQDSSVTLTATGIGGSTFVGWSGDACDGSETATCIVTLDAAKSVTAHFSKGVVVYYTLTINVAVGLDVFVWDANGEYVQDCNNEGTTPFCSYSGLTGDFTLTADPSAGVTFVGCTVNALTGACPVKMDGDKTVTVTFTGGGVTTASNARSESGASPLRDINSASVTSGLPATRSAFVEQQR